MHAVSGDAGFGQDLGGLQHLSPYQLFATFVAGGVVLEDMPKPAWWALEYVLVPYFIIPVMVRVVRHVMCYSITSDVFEGWPLICPLSASAESR